MRLLPSIGNYTPHILEYAVLSIFEGMGKNSHIQDVIKAGFEIDISSVSL